ncbi:MAG: hypothetical protein ACI845_001412, partial [Gammaproteobacteria bacterium]
FFLIHIKFTDRIWSKNRPFMVEKKLVKTKYETRVIECPVQKRFVEVTYETSGKWFNRKQEIQHCPTMLDWSGCDRQCKNLLETSRNSAEWSSLR